jgi:polyphosphate kinase
VKIDLIIRGICCIVPGVPGKTENITVTSIVGRFLEHSRIYCFGTGSERKLYLSSADIMTRNQTRRVEIACPVSSQEIKNIIHDYLERILSDNQKARRLKSDGNYVPSEVGGEPLDLQKWYMEHPLELAETVVPKKGLKNRFFGMFRK